MPAIAGLRGTGDWGTDERPKNFREYILWRNPNGTAPLHALSAKMRSESTDDPEFSWWEEELNSTRVQTNATTAYAAAGTTLVLSAAGGGNNLVAGDVLLVEIALTSSYTNEIIVVASVTDDNTIVVTRGQANTTATTIATNTYLTKIGSVFAEGTGAPSSSTRNPTKFMNLCQIFKTTYDLTNTTKKTKARTGDPLKNDKKRKMWDHSTALEWAWWLGKRHETTGSNGKPLRYAGGFVWFMSQYASSRITAFTTTPTESTLLDAVYPIWDYNAGAGTERIAFCGNGALNSLNKLAKASTSTRINFDGYISAYGMRLQRWIFPQGEIYLKTHPLFNTHSGGMGMTNAIAVLDPSAIRYRYLRDTAHKDNIQANDEDKQKGQWLSECSVEWEHLKTMCLLSNFVVP